MHLSRQKQEIIQANNTVQFSAWMSFFLQFVSHFNLGTLFQIPYLQDLFKCIVTLALFMHINLLRKCLLLNFFLKKLLLRKLLMTSFISSKTDLHIGKVLCQYDMQEY